MWLIAALATAPAHAHELELPLSGVLQRDGSPVTGNVSASFTIRNDEGDVCGTGPSILLVREGKFVVQLNRGIATCLESSLLDRAPHRIGVTLHNVAGQPVEVELAPEMPLNTTEPFALACREESAILKAEGWVLDLDCSQAQERGVRPAAIPIRSQ